MCFYSKRFALNIIVFKKPLGRNVGFGKANDYTVDSRLAARFVVPLECPMGEKDFHALIEHPAPQDAHLLALRNGIGGNKCRADIFAFHEADGFDIPGSDIIQKPRVFDAVKNNGDIFSLFIVHKFRAHKRRISQDVA